MSLKFESRSGEKAVMRRAYEAPRLARVDLQADEVLANGCKMVTWGTGSQASVINCIAKMCAAAGS